MHLFQEQGLDEEWQSLAEQGAAGSDSGDDSGTGSTSESDGGSEDGGASCSSGQTSAAASQAPQLSRETLAKLLQRAQQGGGAADVSEADLTEAELQVRPWKV